MSSKRIIDVDSSYENMREILIIVVNLEEEQALMQKIKKWAKKKKKKRTLKTLKKYAPKQWRNYNSGRGDASFAHFSWDSLQSICYRIWFPLEDSYQASLFLGKAAEHWFDFEPYRKVRAVVGICRNFERLNQCVQKISGADNSRLVTKMLDPENSENLDSIFDQVVTDVVQTLHAEARALAFNLIEITCPLDDTVDKSSPFGKSSGNLTKLLNAASLNNSKRKIMLAWYALLCGAAIDALKLSSEAFNSSKNHWKAVALSIWVAAALALDWSFDLSHLALTLPFPPPAHSLKDDNEIILALTTVDIMSETSISLFKKSKNCQIFVVEHLLRLARWRVQARQQFLLPVCQQQKIPETLTSALDTIDAQKLGALFFARVALLAAIICYESGHFRKAAVFATTSASACSELKNWTGACLAWHLTLYSLQAQKTTWTIVTLQTLKHNIIAAGNAADIIEYTTKMSMYLHLIAQKFAQKPMPYYLSKSSNIFLFFPNQEVELLKQYLFIFFQENFHYLRRQNSVSQYFQLKKIHVSSSSTKIQEEAPDYFLIAGEKIKSCRIEFYNPFPFSILVSAARLLFDQPELIFSAPTQKTNIILEQSASHTFEFEIMPLSAQNKYIYIIGLELQFFDFYAPKIPFFFKEVKKIQIFPPQPRFATRLIFFPRYLPTQDDEYGVPSVPNNVTAYPVRNGECIDAKIFLESLIQMQISFLQIKCKNAQQQEQILFSYSSSSCQEVIQDPPLFCNPLSKEEILLYQNQINHQDFISGKKNICFHFSMHRNFMNQNSFGNKILEFQIEYAAVHAKNTCLIQLPWQFFLVPALRLISSEWSSSNASTKALFFIIANDAPYPIHLFYSNFSQDGQQNNAATIIPASVPAIGLFSTFFSY
mmetsp:Transcript_16318/g.24513  ORF Transcript_16318/g.24513 Transcript_16318/m.24513 type:complete len:883 (+) Transcript_16318:39-2687(+)